MAFTQTAPASQFQQISYKGYLITVFQDQGWEFSITNPSNPCGYDDEGDFIDLRDLGGFGGFPSSDAAYVFGLGAINGLLDNKIEEGFITKDDYEIIKPYAEREYWRILG